MQGQIKKIWENETSSGQRYWAVSIEGQRYNIWNPKHISGLTEGDYVSYEFKESGRYRNISKIDRIEDPPTSGPGSPSTEHGYRAPDRNAQIVRMSVLRSAAEVLYNSDMPWEEKGRYTIELARQFERYVTGFDDTSPESGASLPASEGSSEQSGSHQKPMPPAPPQRRPAQQPATPPQPRPGQSRPAP